MEGTYQPTPRRRRVLVAGWLAILAVSGVLRGWNLGSPMEEGWHSMGLQVANAARNHLAYGLTNTRGFMVQNPGPASPEEFTFYTRHPPLLSLIHAAVFRVFGETLTVYRVTLICLSLMSLGLLMALAYKVYGRSTSFFSGVVMGICPHAVVWATGGEVIGDGLMAFVLAGLAGRLCLKPLMPRLGAVVEIGGYAAASLFDWPGFLAFGIPLLDALIRGRGRKAILSSLKPLLAGIALFVAIDLWVVFSMASVPGRQAGMRSTEAPLHWSAVHAIQEIIEDPRHAMSFLNRYVEAQSESLSLPLVLLTCVAAALGIVRITKRSTGNRAHKSGSFPLCWTVGAPSVIYCILMLRQTLAHPFITVLILPWLALMAGVTLSNLWSRGRMLRFCVTLWLAWYAKTAIPHEIKTLEALRNDGIAQACALATAESDDRDLLLLYEYRDLYIYDWYSQRNRIYNCRSIDLPWEARRYLRSYPGAQLTYILPPISKSIRLYGGSREAAVAEYRRIETLLDSHWGPRSVNGYRVYSIR